MTATSRRASTAARRAKVAPRSAALPRGYWGPDRTRPILDKVQTIRFEVDLSGLGPGERGAIDELVTAGQILQDLAELTEHHQALDARARLHALHERLGEPAETADLLTLYGLFQGPIATTLENKLEPFLPVDGFVGGRNVYPWGIEAAEVEAFLARRPEQRPTILGLHTVVRRTTPTALRRDLANLRRHRELAALHPGLEERLTALSSATTPEALYAVPYSVAWPSRVLGIAAALWRAGDAVEAEDRDFAAFLRLRSRDLLTDDNEAGDAAWVRGTFGHVDVVIGAHEPYDDDLFGAKAFFGLSILVRDEGATRELNERTRHLQDIENALPIDRHRIVSSDIPIGSFDVVAAFGQGVGTAAEILPNDPVLIRKYGRKIALRRNTVVHPSSMERLEDRWRAVMAPVHIDELTAEGVFRQISWHEVGHYLGPDTDRAGRALEETLGEDAAPLEELKSELVSMFACAWLGRIGAFTQAEVRAVVAHGILGAFRPARPLRSQPYPTIWLMLGNHLLEQGALRIGDDGVHIDHDRIAAAVEQMLGETLAIQDHGSHADSTAFIERHSTWDERHERLAARIKAAERYRYRNSIFEILEPRTGPRSEPAGSSRGPRRAGGAGTAGPRGR